VSVERGRWPGQPSSENKTNRRAKIEATNDITVIMSLVTRDKAGLHPTTEEKQSQIHRQPAKVVPSYMGLATKHMQKSIKT